jgi:hypothetical protein
MARGILVAAAVGAGAVLSGCGGGGGGKPFVAPPGDVAALRTTLSGSGDLWIVDDTGTNARSVIGTPANPNDVEIGAVVWSPARNRLAFVADLSATDNSRHVYVVDPSVGTPVDLTPTAPAFATASLLAWSDDGLCLAWIGAGEVAGRDDLHVTVVEGDVDVRRVNQIGDPAPASPDVASFAWKPASHRLAYVGDMVVEGQDDLYFVDADGTGHAAMAHLGGAGADVSSIAWAPTGDRLGFLAQPLAGNPARFVHTVLADGTGAVPVGSQPPAETTAAFQWRPGSPVELAFARGGPDSDDPSVLFRASGETGSSLQVGIVGAGGPASESQFAYAGSALLYELGDGNGRVALHAAPEGGGDVVVFDFPSNPGLYGVQEWRVAPNGLAVGCLYEGASANDGYDLFVATPDGSVRHRVNDELPLSPDYGQVTFWDWSPDSERIAFEVDLYPDVGDDSAEVYVVEVAGGDPLLVDTTTDRIDSMEWTSNGAYFLWLQRGSVERSIHVGVGDGSATRSVTDLVPGKFDSSFVR